MQQLAIEQFRQHLIRQERSIATVEKYIRDTRSFLAFVDGKELSKDLTMQYKETLVRSGYAVRSINSMLAAVNSFLEFMNRRECRVKTIKLQKEVYCREDRLLTKAEYMRLLDAAKAHPRLFLLLQTICGTGIRISELSHFTVEAVRQGRLWCIVRAKPEQFCFLKSFGRFCWHTQSRSAYARGLSSAHVWGIHSTGATSGRR